MLKLYLIYLIQLTIIYTDLAIAELTAESRLDVAAENASTGAGQALGGLIGTLGAAFIGTL